MHTCHCEVLDNTTEVIVYDQGYIALSSLPEDSFVGVLLSKLVRTFAHVKFVVGGFLEFQSAYPTLCEDKKKTHALTALSQPCYSLSNSGPTKILPFLYLGSQNDSLNKQLLLVSESSLEWMRNECSLAVQMELLAS